MRHGVKVTPKTCSHKDAQTKSRDRDEESALGMVQRSLLEHAAIQDVPFKCQTEESAGVMEGRSLSKNAVMKDAPTKCQKEEYTGAMEERGLLKNAHEGCTNEAQKGGVCIRHGATWTEKICSHEGCTNYAINEESA